MRDSECPRALQGPRFFAEARSLMADAEGVPKRASRYPRACLGGMQNHLDDRDAGGRHAAACSYFRLLEIEKLQGVPSALRVPA